MGASEDAGGGGACSDTPSCSDGKKRKFACVAAAPPPPRAATPPAGPPAKQQRWGATLLREELAELLREELAHLRVEASPSFEERARQAYNEVRLRDEQDRQAERAQLQGGAAGRQPADTRAPLCLCEKYPHGVRLRSEPADASKYKSTKEGKPVYVKPSTPVFPCGPPQNGFTPVKTIGRYRGWLRTAALRPLRPPDAAEQREG